MEAFGQILMFFGQVYFGLLLPDKDSQRFELFDVQASTVSRYLRVYQAFKYSS